MVIWECSLTELLCKCKQFGREQVFQFGRTDNYIALYVSKQADPVSQLWQMVRELDLQCPFFPSSSPGKMSFFYEQLSNPYEPLHTKTPKTFKPVLPAVKGLHGISKEAVGL